MNFSLLWVFLITERRSWKVPFRDRKSHTGRAWELHDRPVCGLKRGILSHVGACSFWGSKFFFESFWRKLGRGLAYFRVFIFKKIRNFAVALTRKKLLSTAPYTGAELLPLDDHFLGGAFQKGEFVLLNFFLYGKIEDFSSFYVG